MSLINIREDVLEYLYNLGEKLMALSKTCLEVFDEAQGALRNALAYAARNERPYHLRKYRKTS